MQVIVYDAERQQLVRDLWRLVREGKISRGVVEMTLNQYDATHPRVNVVVNVNTNRRRFPM